MLNKIMLIGNLGRDPELQVTPDGTPVTKFTLAVNRYSKTSSGERKEETDWFNVSAWRQLAETCEKYLHKGSKVYVEGRLSQRKYTDREGAQRTSIDVTITEMEMLTPKSASSSSEGYSAGSSDSGDPFLPDFPDE
jgi:single-strand DNA-binding protein